MVRAFMAVLWLALLTAPAWGQELKVGFVSLQKAISESKSGQSARESFQTAIKEKQDALLKEKQAIENRRKELEKQAVLMKESERAKVQREFQLRVRDYERKTRDMREELALREQEVTNAILKDLQKVIAEVGKTGRFTIILEQGQLLYTDKGIDITDEVIRLYNERFQNDKER